MKFLLTSFVILFAQQAFAVDEADKIQLIPTGSYERVPGTAQNFKSSTTVWFGDLVGKADIEKKIKTSLAPFKKDLAKYFPQAGEFDRMVDSLVLDVNTNIVKGDLDDKKLIQVNKFFGNKLIGKIYDRILEVEGVKDPERRKVWVNKLTAPFNTCIDKSTNAMYGASHCMDVLQNSLMPNSGLAIVYEMSNSKLAGILPEKERTAFNLNQTVLYKNCMNTLPVSAQSLMHCALKAMRYGVLKVVDASATKTINSSTSSLNVANAIKAKTWPKFNKCVEDVRSGSRELSDQFNDCIDDLILNISLAIVPDKISSTAAVKEQFTKLDLAKFVSEKTAIFKSCAEDKIKKGIRKDGIIDIDQCQTMITNKVTYDVILKTFDKNARENLDGNKEKINLANGTGKIALDSCFNDNLEQKERDRCVKKSVIIFANNIAEYKLNKAIPLSVSGRSKIFISASESLNKCLEKNLPSNITESSETSAKLALCGSELTTQVARIVAESEVRSALKNKLPSEEIEKLVVKFVHKDFISCIGTSPTDAVLDKCTNNLKISVVEKVLDPSINEYLGDRPDIDLKKLRTDIKAKLMNDFANCLKNGPNKDTCTDELLKNADQTIVLAYGRTEASIQLNTDKLPTKLDAVEEELIKCTKTNKTGDELGLHLDECNKNFALGFAKTLGNIKLKYLLEQALGTKTLEEQSKIYNSITDKYNKCLDDLKTVKMSDGLTDKIGICTKELEKNALGFVRSNFSDWMSTEDKDATTLAVKSEFAMILPCLSALLPSSPYDPNLKANTESILKPLAVIVAQYIEYSPEDARSNLQEIIKKLNEDLKATSDTTVARNNLLDLLYKNGALDQFIKSIVRGKVRESFETLSENDLPKSIREKLITKENFDEIFNSAEGKNIKDTVMKEILKPLLMENASMGSPTLTTAMDSVNNQVVKMLVASPKFGDEIVKSGIQKQIDKMGGFTKFMAKVFYGSDNLKWDKVRESELGKKAEAYIKENLLMPKFSGKPMTRDEEKRVGLTSEILVKEAVKKYEAP